MALEAKEGIAGAFVDKKTEIFLSTDTELTEEGLNEILKEYKIKVSEVKKNAEVSF